MIRLLTLMCHAATALVAQIHAGQKAGVPLTDLTRVSSNGANTIGSLPSHWTLGPMIELDLPLGLGVEFDARRL